jgi:DNA-binding protein HU-beta
VEGISMNKSELIAEIAAKSKMTKKDSETSLNAFTGSIEDSLKKGDKIVLVGFGSFEVRKRAARQGVNPQTKEPIKIAAKKVPVFRAGKNLKELVNGKAVKKTEKKKK